MIPLFDLQAQYQSIKPEIDSAVAHVLSSGHYIGGDEVALFERELADKLHVKYAVSCASGTDALILSLRAAGIGPGDEVILPAFSFWATASAVLHVGTRPVFVNISPDTGQISVTDTLIAITAETKAIVPVHLYGHPVDDEDIINYYPPIERCKIEIERNARSAGLRFNKADIISVYEKNLKGTIVFLHRFNPELITDIRGNPILDEKGNRQYLYQNPIHAEYRPNHSSPINVLYAHLERTQVKIVVICPWLVRIVMDDGTIINKDDCLYSAFQQLEFL